MTAVDSDAVVNGNVYLVSVSISIESGEGVQNRSRLALSTVPDTKGSTSSWAGSRTSEVGDQRRLCETLTESALGCPTLSRNCVQVVCFQCDMGFVMGTTYG